jgi:ketosteroid isomerase-like protein
MPKANLQAANFIGTPDEVEAAFYEALQLADLERLMTCWADEDDIVCIHPGGPRLVGMVAIRCGFDAIFSQEGGIRVQPQFIRRIHSVTGAVHSVLERIEVLTAEGPVLAFVLTTNVFHKTPQGWRMVVHHASPGTHSEMQEINAGPTLLH